MRAFLNSYLETISPLCPLIILLIGFKNNMSKDTRILFVLYSLSAFICIIIAVLSYLHLPNIIFYTTLVIVQFFTISFFFINIIKDKKKVRLIIRIMLFYLLFLPFNFTFLETSAVYTSISTAAAALLVILFCFIYFRERLIFIDMEDILVKRNFFIVVSFFLYYAGAFFIFLTYKTITIESINYTDLSARKSIGTLWGIHNIIYFLSCLMASFGLLWYTFRIKHI